MTKKMQPEQTKTDIDSKIEHIQKLSHLLDDKYTIPGTKIGFGYDTILGLIPVVGDTLSLSVSLYILNEARLCGVRKRTITRMLGNIGYDYVIGLIPLVGDILDIASKSNLKNANLLIEQLERQKTIALATGTAHKF